MKMRRISPDWGLNEFTEGFSYLLSLLILTRSLHIGPISHYTDKEAEAQRNLLRTVEWGSQGSCMQAPASLSHVRTCTHTEKRFLWSLCPDRDKRPQPSENKTLECAAGSDSRRPPGSGPPHSRCLTAASQMRALCWGSTQDKLLDISKFQFPHL